MAGSSVLDDLSALSEKLSAVKPGVKTTEFVVSAITAVIGLLTSLGLIHHGPSSTTLQAFAAIGVAVVVGAYSISRAISKHGKIDPLATVESLFYSTKDGDPQVTTVLGALLPSLAARAGVNATTLSKIETDAETVKSFVEAHLDEIKGYLSSKEPATPAPVAPAVPPGQMPISPPGLVTTVTSPAITTVPAPLTS